ncbi:MAG: hypothetical protein J0L92_26295, partial [Deltaproteobacteria bacterium]|nr:hypothetical protein [Deltaproteobacteria bacterium]
TRRAATAAKALPPPPPPSSPRPRGPGLHPGDVLMHDGLEHALERASELEDGTLVRVLEVIATPPRFVVQLDHAGERILLATSYDELPEGRVADVVALGVRSLQLVRRGEASARPVLDDHGVLFTGRCRFTVLADRAGRHLVVVEPEGAARLCLVGDLVDRRRIDVLPGG